MRRELTDDERDSYAEHFYGYGPLPGSGPRDPEPTDDGLCERCGELNNGSTFTPYCSEACEEAALAERDAEEEEEGEQA